MLGDVFYSVIDKKSEICSVESWALSRISPQVRVRVSVNIMYRIATGGYSWIWPCRASGMINVS